MTFLLFATFATCTSAAFFALGLPWFGAIWAGIAILNGVCFLVAKKGSIG